MAILIFALKRFAAAIVVLFAVSVLTFLIFFAIPNGDPALRLAGRTATAQTIASVRHDYGFDRPLYIQYLKTMKQVFDGSIQSYTQHVTVFSQIERGLPATLSLAIGAAIIWMFFGIVLGVVGATRAGKPADIAITTFSFAGISAPSFVLGSILLTALTYKLHLFPEGGGYSPFSAGPVAWVEHLILPWITLAVLYIGIYAQVLRSSVLEAMSTDAVRTARAKGLSPRRVLLKHVLRVSLIPIASLWGLDFAAVLGGSTLVVEKVFNLNGVGQYAADSVGSLDVPPVLVIVLLGAAIVVLMNAVVDVVYATLDPPDQDDDMSGPEFNESSLGTDEVLRVEHLKVTFRTERGVVQAVDDVSFAVRAGEVLAIVGESGSGKSVSAMTLMGLTRSPNATISGSARLSDGTELVTAGDREMQHIRGKRIAMIFQDPMSALTPVYRVGDQIVEQIRAHSKVSKAAARDHAVQLLERVGIPRAAERSRAYPHQFSGGMRQRVMIAMALSCEPEILIADEPTTALDVTIQSQILAEIEDLRRETGVAVLLITHDLGVVAEVASRVVVMYAGRVVEESSVNEIFKDPLHPYSWGLLGSIPRIDKGRPERLSTILGSPPSLLAPPSGCHFKTRCPHRFDRCDDEPELQAVEPGSTHRDRCHLSLQDKRRLRVVNGAIGLPVPAVVEA